MKRMVASCLLLIVSCSCFGQLADQLPDTISKKKIIGSYVLMNGGSHTEINIKSNHNIVFNGQSKISAPSVKSKWEIRNDTLLIRDAISRVITKRMVMHNEKLHLIRKDGSADPAALMTKKDYKYYQRQCKSTGK